MNKSIILLTKNFPYDIGEDFLENEIEVLSEMFPNIYIIATAVTGEGKVTKRIPSNVKCFPMKECNKRSIRYLKYIVYGLTRITSKAVRKEISSKPSIIQKLAVLYIAGRSHSTENKIKKIKEIIAEFEEQTTILYSYWFADLAYLGSNIKQSYDQIKTVSRAHGYDLYEERNPGKSIPFRTDVFRSINRVFTCSYDGKMYLENKYPEYAEKIELSYLGTRDNGLANEKPHELFHLVTCSSIIPLKRVHLLVDAIRILEQRKLYVEWTCIGDGPLLPDIRKNVLNNIRKSKVVFTGRISNTAVLEIYRHQPIDLFVNISETEGLPVSIMEAISFGIPVLATNVGGTKEIVKDNTTGRLLPKNITPLQIADEIENMMSSSIDRNRIRSYWKENFNADDNYRRFAEILTEL